ncbi:monovalent cation/H(+) antiporter subunit G [Cellulosimicrobium sp. CUA-896]|uniref:monovalent cation/H(+) antiporter subunit G n=1 Tax=Cellulosimicrobium sp. CUA-896 TaxID=1517881 RepID=UPI000A8E9B0D
MDAAFWDAVADVVAAVLLLLGAFLAFAAGVGVVRFPDLLARMHAATKPQVLGLILVLLGLSLRLRSWGVVATLALVVAFQLLTSPVAAHMVGRAGYRTGKVRTGASSSTSSRGTRPRPTASCWASTGRAERTRHAGPSRHGTAVRRASSSRTARAAPCPRTPRPGTVRRSPTRVRRPATGSRRRAGPAGRW